MECGTMKKIRCSATVPRVLGLVLLAATACSRKAVAEKTFYPMAGIPFMVKAYDVPEGLFDKTVDAIRAQTEALEAIFSTYSETSELSRINRKGGGQASPELAQVLKLAFQISADTQGAFDVTVGPVLDLWRECGKLSRLPTEEEMRARLELVDWRQVSLSNNHYVSFRRKNMSLDLGGIAKGFMADAAAEKMKKQGIRRGIVDVGGDLVLFNSLGEEPFRVGIKHPERPDVRFAVLEIDSGAVVTSGCYERFVVIGNQRICHIVDPRTGAPADSLVSATIVAQEGATADALATAVMVLGKERGKAMVNSLPGVGAVLIWKEDGKLNWWISPSLQGKVRVEAAE